MSERETKKPAKRPRLRRLRRIVGAATLVAGLVVGLAVVLLHTSAGKDWALRRALAVANGALAGHLDAERLSGRWWDQLSVHHVRLRDARGETVAFVEQASVHYSIPGLLSDPLVVDRVELDGVVFLSKTYPDGASNLSLIAQPSDAPPGPPSAFSMRVEHLRVKRAAALLLEAPPAQEAASTWLDRLEASRPPIDRLGVEIETVLPAVDAPASGSLAFSDVSLEASFEMHGPMDLRARLEALEARVTPAGKLGARPVSLVGLTAQWRPERAEASLEEFEVEGLTSLAGVSASADLTTSEDPLGNRSTTGLERYSLAWRELQVPADALGALGLDGGVDVRGPLVVALNATGSARQHSAALSSTCAGQPLDIEADVKLPSRDRPIWAYDITATAEDFAGHRCASPLANIERLTGTATLRGEGVTRDDLAATGAIEVSHARVFGQEIDSAKLRARAADGALELEALEVSAMGSRLKGHGRAALDGRFDISVEVTADGPLSPELAAASGLPLGVGPVDLSLVATGTADVHADSPWQMADDLDLRARWDLADFAFGDALSIGASRGDVRVKLDRQGSQRGVDVEASLSARRARGPGFAAGSLAVDGSGSGQLAADAADPIELIQTLASRWSLRARSLRVGADRLDDAVIALSLGRRPPDGAWRWRLDGSSSGISVDQLAVDQIKADLAGDASLVSTPGGVEVRRGSARGRVDAQGLEAAGTTVDTLSAQVDLAGRLPWLQGAFDLDASKIDAQGERVERASVRAAADGPSFDVAIGVERGDDRPPLSLRAKGQRWLRGTGVDLTRLELGAPDMMWTLPTPAAVGMRRGAVEVRDLTLLHDTQRIALNGVYASGRTHSLRAEIAALDIGALRDALGLPIPLDLEARISADATLAGTDLAPEIGLGLRVADIQARGYGPMQLILDATYAAGQVDLDQLKVEGWGAELARLSGRLPARVDLLGRAEVEAARPMELLAEVPGLAISDLYMLSPTLADLGAAGVLRAKLRLGGTPSAPTVKSRIAAEDLAIAGNIAGQAIALDGVSMASRLDYQRPGAASAGLDLGLRAEWNDSQVLDASLTLPISLDAWARQLATGRLPSVDWERLAQTTGLRAEVALGPIDLSEVDVSSLTDADADGRVWLNLSAAGTLGTPEISVDAGVSDFGWQRFRDIYLDLAVRQSNGVLAIDQIRFEWDSDEIFVARGQLPIPIDQWLDEQSWGAVPLDLTLELQELPVRKLSALDYSLAGIRGSFTGFLQARGTLRAPDLRARFGIFNTEFARGRVGTIGLEVGARGRAVSAQASLCLGDREVLSAQARVPANLDAVALADGAAFLRDEPIEASVKSEPLRLAQLVPTRLFDDYVSDVDGVLQVDLALAGPRDDLRLSGGLDLDRGAVTLPFVGRRFDDIAIDLDLEADQANLREFTLSERDSSLGLAGTIGLDGLSPTVVDLELRSEEFNIEGLGTTLAAYITSEIGLEGDLGGEEPSLTATAESLEIGLPETQAADLHPTELNEDIVVVRPDESSRPGLALKGLADPNSERRPFALRFIATRRNWLRHPNGDVEFAADISARIEGSNVQMGGAVDTIRGSIEFLGKRFDIPAKEGVVRFTGAASPNPRLDIEAFHVLDERIAEALPAPSSGQARVVVRVRGPSDDPRLLLSSDPGQTESDIIQILVTGRPPDDSAVGQDQGLQGQALSAATGLLSGLVQQKLAGAVPVDLLRLEAGEEGLESSRISVGKYITDRLFVSYSYKFGGDEEEAENVAKIEYRFYPRWKLETQYSDQQTGEFNIFWEPPLRWLNE